MGSIGGVLPPVGQTVYRLVTFHPAPVGVGGAVGGVVLHHAGHGALQVGFGLLLAAGSRALQKVLFAFGIQWSFHRKSLLSGLACPGAALPKRTKLWYTYLAEVLDR